MVMAPAPAAGPNLPVCSAREKSACSPPGAVMGRVVVMTMRLSATVSVLPASAADQPWPVGESKPSTCFWGAGSESRRLISPPMSRLPVRSPTTARPVMVALPAVSISVVTWRKAATFAESSSLAVMVRAVTAPSWRDTFPTDPGTRTCSATMGSGSHFCPSQTLAPVIAPSALVWYQIMPATGSTGAVGETAGFRLDWPTARALPASLRALSASFCALRARSRTSSAARLAVTASSIASLRMRPEWPRCSTLSSLPGSMIGSEILTTRPVVSRMTRTRAPSHVAMPSDSPTAWVTGPS